MLYYSFEKQLIMNNDTGAGMKEIIVIGHKNPDTDSICSAIAYAELKRELTGLNYEAKRAGHLNEETKYVLEHFNIKVPEYVKDVSTQIRDIDIHYTKGVDSGISLKQAWNIMQKDNIVTLPITESDRLQGLITVGDITGSYMEIYDNRILSKAATKYKNIVSTLEGEMLIGDDEDIFDRGKVIVAAGNIDAVEEHIAEGDLVILGNRAETQMCAVQMGAAAIIVCEEQRVSKTIELMAREKGCRIITTPYDIYIVARLINQSMPVEYFMKKEKLVTFSPQDKLEDIQGIMANKRYRDFPVIDKDGRYVGMLSRRNLLGAKRKQIVLVDHNEKNQAVAGIEKAEILEIIDHHRLGTVETVNPVFFRNQPLGSTATIIYQMYCEERIEIKHDIAALLCAAIISDTLMYRSPTCTSFDKAAATALAEIADIDIERFAMEMFNAGGNLSSKSIKDIFYQDYKRFTVNDIRIGIGQINSMNSEELDNIRPEIIKFMKENAGSEDVVYFLLTDIMNEASTLLYSGKNAELIIKNAFGLEWSGDSVVLPGVVSRKKQFLPPVVEVIQQ